uniref:DNA polymerase eta n=1 Tax=Caenorhabditis japonica TaxID=281687 RepID=A0A8R1DUT7_CAEJA
MSVVEAKSKCHNLNVCHVPVAEHADKADIEKYRNASVEVFKVLNNIDSSIVVEKASVDEAFLDMTSYVDQRLIEFKKSDKDVVDYFSMLPTSYVVNGKDENEKDRESHLESFVKESLIDEDYARILIAGIAVEQIRDQILGETKFHCSAGVGNNKMMAKLVCSRHKPRKQTLVPWRFAKEILKTTPIKDVRGFGGKLGYRIQEKLHITFIGELLTVDHSLVTEEFPEQHDWLMAVAEGYDDEPVRPRSECSSIAVSKNFPGRNAIDTVAKVRQWTHDLLKELSKRLITDQVQNKRTAENLVVSILPEGGGTQPQKTLKLTSYHPDIMFEQVWSILKLFNRSENEAIWKPKVLNMSMSASRFCKGVPAQSRVITEWLKSKKNQTLSTEPTEFDDEIMIIPFEKAVESSAPDVIYLHDDAVALEKNNHSDERDLIKIDGKSMLRSTFHQLPPNIKQQYEHRMALECARQLKLSAEHKGRSGRKRQNNTNGDKQKKFKKSGECRQIKDFFTKEG